MKCAVAVMRSWSVRNVRRSIHSSNQAFSCGSKNETCNAFEVLPRRWASATAAHGGLGAGCGSVLAVDERPQATPCGLGARDETSGARGREPREREAFLRVGDGDGQLARRSDTGPIAAGATRVR